jgi:hypothetical protein
MAILPLFAGLRPVRFLQILTPTAGIAETAEIEVRLNFRNFRNFRFREGLGKDAD